MSDNTITLKIVVSGAEVSQAKQAKSDCGCGGAQQAKSDRGYSAAQQAPQPEMLDRDSLDPVIGGRFTANVSAKTNDNCPSSAYYRAVGFAPRAYDISCGQNGYPDELYMKVYVGDSPTVPATPPSGLTPITNISPYDGYFQFKNVLGGCCLSGSYVAGTRTVVIWAIWNGCSPSSTIMTTQLQVDCTTLPTSSDPPT